MSVYTRDQGKLAVISNGLGRTSLEILNVEDSAITLNIVGPRGAVKANVRVTKDDLRQALLLTGIAKRR